MAYIGRDTDKISNVEVLDNITFDGSSSYTLQKGGSNFTPSSANTLLLSIDGVVQAGNFTVSGSTIDFGTAVAGTSTCDFILHYGVGLITVPSDGTVTTAKLADSSVTTAKLNDSAVTTAKLNDASVSLAKLTATGTKDATTFLRGDNTFAEAGGGTIGAFSNVLYTGGAVGSSSSTFSVITGSQISLTPSATSSKIFYQATLQGCRKTGNSYMEVGLQRKIGSGSYSTIDIFVHGFMYSNSTVTVTAGLPLNFVDSPSTTSEVTYQLIFRNVPATGLVNIHTDSQEASQYTLMEIKA